MIGYEQANITLEYLEGLVKNINPNQGILNCGYCALRLDLHIAEGQNLDLNAVPTTTADMLRTVYFKKQTIIRAVSKDPRLKQRCVSNEQPIREICNLDDETPQFIVDLTAELTTESSLRLHRATIKDIYQQLRDLPRRKKDNTAYGFVMLTHENNADKGHIINFFVDSNDEVYFLDAQRKTKVEQISRLLFLKGYRSEIFFIPSCPPEGNKLVVKREKDLERELFIGFSPDNNEEKIIQAKNRIKEEPQNLIAWYALRKCYTNENKEKYQENSLRCIEKVNQLGSNAFAYAFYWYSRLHMQNELAETIACADKIFEWKEITDKQQADIWNILATKYLLFELKDCSFHCLLYANKLDPLDKQIWKSLKAMYEKMPNQESKTQLCASNIQKIESNLPPDPLNEQCLYFNNVAYNFGDKVPRPHLHLKSNSKVVTFLLPTAPSLAIVKPASLPVATKPVSPPAGVSMPVATKPASPPSSFIPGLATATFLPSQTSTLPTSSAVIVNAPQLSEVDWLKKEVALKQRRIEVMDDEIKMKDQQIAELKRQLSEKKAALNQIPKM